MVWPNRAADPFDEDIIERAMPFAEDFWTGDRADSWYLEVLAVDPEFQGQGIGRMLVDWGLGRACEEGVSASVFSAKGKEPFYLKSGFPLEDGHVGVGANNPLSGWEGGPLFWMVAEKQSTNKWKNRWMLRLLLGLATMRSGPIHLFRRTKCLVDLRLKKDVRETNPKFTQTLKRSKESLKQNSSSSI